MIYIANVALTSLYIWLSRKRRQRQYWIEELHLKSEHSLDVNETGYGNLMSGIWRFLCRGKDSIVVTNREPKTTEINWDGIEPKRSCILL